MLINKKMENFNNNASMVGFIGDYASVEEVTESDTRELEEIGGSFEAIADRIRSILDYAEKTEKGKGFSLANPNFDENVEVTFYGITKGSQFCPFEGCEIRGWGEMVKIRNPQSGRELTINKGIEHLARDHNLLEKGNEYGFSAKEFYDHFMPKKG